MQSVCAIFGCVTLTSGLSLRIIVSRAYLRKFPVWMDFGVVDCIILCWGHCDIDL